MLTNLNVVLCAIGGAAIGWLVLATLEHLHVLLDHGEERPED